MIPVAAAGSAGHSGQLSHNNRLLLVRPCCTLCHAVPTRGAGTQPGSRGSGHKRPRAASAGEAMSKLTCFSCIHIELQETAPASANA
eukprot:24538-Alexandrium_andersonii.AAC.2